MWTSVYKMCLRFFVKFEHVYSNLRVIRIASMRNKNYFENCFKSCNLSAEAEDN